MLPELSHYLDSDLSYVYQNGPLHVTSLQEAQERGLNCQTLTHLLLKDLGINLSPEMRSKEIFEDDKLFRPLPKAGPFAFGDVFMFGKPFIKDARALHLAVSTGKNDEKGNPLLIHANPAGVSIWQLEQFAQTKQYQTLYAIKRYTGDRLQQ